MLQEKNFSQILSDKDDQLRGPVYNQEKKVRNSISKPPWQIGGIDLGSYFLDQTTLNGWFQWQSTTFPPRQFPGAVTIQYG